MFILILFKANNGQAGVGFLINKKWKGSIVMVNSTCPTLAELVLSITKCYKLKIVQVYVPTTSYSEEDMNSFHNDVDDFIGKPNQNTILM